MFIGPISLVRIPVSRVQFFRVPSRGLSCSFVKLNHFSSAFVNALFLQLWTTTYPIAGSSKLRHFDYLNYEMSDYQYAIRFETKHSDTLDNSCKTTMIFSFNKYPFFKGVKMETVIVLLLLLFSMIVNPLEANKEGFRPEHFDQIRPHSIRSLQFDQKVRPLSFRPEKLDLFIATLL